MTAVSKYHKMSQVQPVIRFLILCAIFLAVVGSVDCRRRRYKGYSVLRCMPQTRSQLAKLSSINTEVGAHNGIQFWMGPSDVNRTVDVMVEPEFRAEFESRLSRWEIPTEEIIRDVDAAIEETSRTEFHDYRGSPFNHSLKAQMLSSERYYKQYHPYNEIEAKLDELVSLDPRVTVRTIGRTSENRNLYLVKVSSDPAANKPVILIDGGHHAREWISHATVIYLIESLVNIDIPRQSANTCRDERCRKASQKRTKLDLDNYDYWFVPVVNPDGYEYTHQQDRLWRKTRSRNACSWYSGGVDPNRNYPFHWMEAGASSSPCSFTYAGPRPQSEPEVRAMVSLFDENKGRIVMYLSLHSYSQVILSPYGYDRVLPDNYEDMQTVANSWIKSTAELRGTQYVFGTSAILLYPAAGGSDDYAHGVANVRFAYTIELPDKGAKGFLLPPDEIIPVGQETVMGIESMIQAMEKISGGYQPSS